MAKVFTAEQLIQSVQRRAAFSPDAQSEGKADQDILDVLDEVMFEELVPFIRRLKEDMKKFDGSPCFPPRHVETLSYQLSPEEVKLYEAVTEYVQQNFQRAEQAENRNVGLALTVLQRRLASSVAAIRSSTLVGSPEVPDTE